MKPIYKKILEFTKTNEDLIRKPLKNNKLIKQFKKEYGLSSYECNIFFLIFSLIMEVESSVEAEDIRGKFKLSLEEYLKLLKVTESLKAKGMIVCNKKDALGTNFQPTFFIDENLFNKLVLGEDLLDKYKLDNPYAVIEYVASLIEQRDSEQLSTLKLYSEIDRVLSKVKKNLSNLYLLKQYSDQERAILLISAYEFLNGNQSMLQSHQIADVIEDDIAQRMQLFTNIINGQLQIIQDKYIQLNSNLFVDDPIISLTKKGAQKLFNIKKPKTKKDTTFFELCKHIKYKSLKNKLFFPKKFQTEINRFKNVLKPKVFNNLLKELKQNNYSKSFISLFYGLPGTGKTASVYDIAYTTKRDVLQVDIEKIRDKFVGESEKRLAQIFDEYKEAKKILKRTPILLFNEADALLGQRINVSNSVDQMNNSMQNILLQNLEDFKGIFIATTNLIDNLDDAFSRRFLYKLEFPKPTVQIREKIWIDKLPNLKEDIYVALSKHELSGGQIELVAKQFVIYQFLEKTKQPLLVIENIIKNELSYKQENNSTMGFLTT